MKRRNLALVELTLVILFMALSSAVLVQVFAAARTTSDESRARTVGQAMALDILERWKAGETKDALFAEAEGWQALPPEDWGEFPLSPAQEGQPAEEAGSGAADAEITPAGVYVLLMDKTLSPAAGGETAYYLEVRFGEEAGPAGVLHHIAVQLTARHTGHELVSFMTARYEHTAG